MFKYKYPKGSPLKVNCPHCGRKIGIVRRLERCAYSGEVICTSCIMGGRFSDSVWKKVPEEFQQKFRIYNLVPFIACMVVGLWLIQRAFWQNSGWNLGDLTGSLIMIGKMLIFIGIGIGIVLASIRLPPLGSWIFYRWISKRGNREKVEKAVEEKENGTWRSTNKLFRKKKAFYKYFKDTDHKIVFLVALISNVAILPLYAIIRPSVELAGSVFSMIAGIVLFVSYLSMFIVAFVASKYYCSKARENNKQRKIVEILTWSFFIMFPVMLFSEVIAILASWDVLGDIPASAELPALVLYYIGVIGQPTIAALLNVYLLWFAKPHYGPSVGMPPEVKKTPLYKVKTVSKHVGLVLLIGGLLLFTGMAFLILMADVAMAICVLSSVYLLFGAVIPIVFFIMKLAKKGKPRYNQPYWTLARVSAVVIAINLIPLVGTYTWTNSTLEAQFSDVFGSNWRDIIPDDVESRMRSVRFSWLEAFHGFEVPSNAKFTIPYCEDHPRYVKLHNGTVLANGSSKYTNITDTFVFDAYLPQWLEFNGPSMEKLPVIIFFHGIGMDFGSENVNITSQYLANQGYLVCDMMYGFVDWRKSNDETTFQNRSGRARRNGYDFPDTIHHIGNFTKFLEANADEYHADLDNIYFSGRSFGGWMAAVCAYGYNTTFFGTNFSSSITVRGCLPYYGAHGIPMAGSENLVFGSDGAVNIRGSNNPDDPDYNAEWVYFDPLQLANSSISGISQLCPTMCIHGTNDYLVVAGWSKMLDSALKENDHDSITAFYPLGSHGFDAIHFSQYGQSILYYFERFLAVTRDYS